MLIPTIKRRESVRAAALRRTGVVTKQDKAQAVRAAERIIAGS